MDSKAEYDFAALKRKYGNFFRPECRVIAGTKDLTETYKCRISLVTVSLCLGRTSEAVIELADCYDTENHGMKGALIDGLLPGTDIRISMGYGSELNLLFCGYIDCLEADISEKDGYVLRVKAADVCKLMQDCGRRRRILQVKKYSEAFTAVMKGYSKVCTAKAEATTAVLTQGLFQMESDYDFVTNRLLQGAGKEFEFIVEKGTAYFRISKTGGKPILKLTPGDGIQKLKLGISYMKREVEIQGYSVEQGLLTSAGTITASHVKADSVTGKETVSSPWLTSQEAVNEAAKALGKNLTAQPGHGTVTMVGMPVLLPGNSIMFQEVGSGLNGLYYMSKVEHMIGPKGYSTVIEI